MQCPNCHAQLVMTDRQGVEIDYCPQCRGVWLDRGELDKIIERAGTSPRYAAAPEQSYSHHQERRHDDDDDDRHYERRSGHDEQYRHDTHHKKHKKESFLGDLFDF